MARETIQHYSSEINTGKGYYKKLISSNRLSSRVSYRDFVSMQGEKQDTRDRAAVEANKRFMDINFLKNNAELINGKVYVEKFDTSGKRLNDVNSYTPEQYVNQAKKYGNTFLIQNRPTTSERLKILNVRIAKKQPVVAKPSLREQGLIRKKGTVTKTTTPQTKIGTPKTPVVKFTDLTATEKAKLRVNDTKGITYAQDTSYIDYSKLKQNLQKIDNQEKIIDNIAKKIAPKGVDISKALGTTTPIYISLKDAVQNQKNLVFRAKTDLDSQKSNLTIQAKKINTQLGNPILSTTYKNKLKNELTTIKKNINTINLQKQGLLTEYKGVTQPKSLKELMKTTLRLKNVDVDSKRLVLTKKGLVEQNKTKYYSIINKKLSNDIKKQLDKAEKQKIIKAIKTLNKDELVAIYKNKISPAIDKKLISIATNIEKTRLRNLEVAKPFIQGLKLSSNKKIQPAKTGESLARVIAVTNLAGIGSLNALLGIGVFAKSPIKTSKEIVKSLKNPKKIIITEKGRFEVDPIGFITEWITFSKVFKIGRTTVKKSSLGLYVAKEIFILKQPKKVRPYVRAILDSALTQRKLNPYKIKKIKTADFFKVKELNKIESQALIKTLNQTDSVIFGSFASKVLSKGKTKIPKDVDLATKNITQFNKKFINNLPKEIQKKYKVSKESISKGNKKILDVKPIDRLIPQKSLITRRGTLPIAGYIKKIEFNKKKGYLPKIKKGVSQGQLGVPTQKIVKIGNFKLTGFGEQTLRKGLGTLQVLLEKNTRRAKDPQAFIESLQIQLEALKKSKAITPISKLKKRNKIKKIEVAIKLLSSKQFYKLLKQNIGAIIKEYPTFKKINLSKLKKVKKLSKTELNKKVTKKIKKAKVKKKIAIKRKVKRKSIKKKSKASRLPKAKPSRLPKAKPSRLPKAKPSRLPKAKPSRLPKAKPSRLPKAKPSRLPKAKPSRLPKAKPSRLPKAKPSRLPKAKPSRLPKAKPSRLPKAKPSRLPNKIKTNLLKNIKKKADLDERNTEDKKTKKLIKKLLKKAKVRKGRIYIPDLTAVLRGEAAKGRDKKTLKKVGRIFTGLERRRLIK